MQHIWNKSIYIDEETARNLIESQLALTVHFIRLIDEGWDNSVYLINEACIFRFPHRDYGVFCLENEIALAAHLAKQLSFPISSPKWVGHATEQYPYPFVGYPLIPGIPLCEASPTLIQDKAFAMTLATWLKELHAIKLTEGYINLIKGDHSWRLNVKRRLTRCKENLTQYEKYFLQAGFEKSLLFKIIALFENLNLTEKTKVYLHGDLYCRHILVDPISFLPCGLIDWGDVHVGDPGIDLAAGMIFNESAFNVFKDHYGNIDSERFALMLFHSFCHSMSFLPYAYEQNKKALKKWAAMVLERTIEEINLL
jgi:aminoglycoside phosphotransferase (APT) family kinase protein